jgi:hypothetical protein
MRDIAAPKFQKLSKIIIGFLSGVAAFIMLAGTAGAQNVSFPGSPTDCDTNAVIHCGALTAGDVVKDYQADAYVQKVYQGFGISAAAITNLPANAVAGMVTKSGNVIVNGKTVATGAITAGRTNLPGSTAVTTQGITYYKRPTSVSFQQDSLDAYVVMNSAGQFQFAILASCGNPVAATPVIPPKPKPAPPPAAPASAECTSLGLQKVSDRTYTATVMDTTSGGATLQSITYDFGDGTTIPPTTDTSLTHTYQQDGTFTVTAKLAFNTPSGTTASTTSAQTISSNCQAMITVSTPPAAPPKVLANTGAGNVVGLFTGTTLLSGLGYRAYVLRRFSRSSQ